MTIKEDLREFLSKFPNSTQVADLPNAALPAIGNLLDGLDWSITVEDILKGLEGSRQIEELFNLLLIYQEFFGIDEEFGKLNEYGWQIQMLMWLINHILSSGFVNSIPRKSHHVLDAGGIEAMDCSVDNGFLGPLNPLKDKVTVSIHQVGKEVYYIDGGGVMYDAISMRLLPS